MAVLWLHGGGDEVVVQAEGRHHAVPEAHLEPPKRKSHTWALGGGEVELTGPAGQFLGRRSLKINTKVAYKDDASYIVSANVTIM